MQGQSETELIERIPVRDLSSVVTLRALAEVEGDGWVPVDRLVEEVQERYARLAARPGTSIGDGAPPWEVTPEAGRGIREYLEHQVIHRLADEALVEVAPDGAPAVRLTAPLRERRPALRERLERQLEGTLEEISPPPSSLSPDGPHPDLIDHAPGSTLSAKGLVKVYRKRRVVNDVALQVSQGEIVGLLGPNGAGKTTTFYMMVGLIAPDQGQVAIGKEDVTAVPMYRRARKGVGYLAQEPSVFRKLTVEQNVLAILQMLGLSKKEQRARLEVLLDELGIKHLRSSKAYALSGGERRRLEITRALVGQPKFMLLDEPFAGVDPIAVHDIQQIVADLRRRNIGVLISDHNVEQTLDIVDRAYIMYDGRVRVSGTVSELVWNDEVAEIYLGPTLTARMRQRYTYPE